MSTSAAWLLECGESLAIAVGDHEMVELVQTAQMYPVPGAPEYCSAALLWQEHIVPVMNLYALHGGGQHEGSGSYQCLLYYQEASSAPLQMLALQVDKAPERILVDDAQVCDLPPEFEASPLRDVALSCFTHHAKPVLVLDIARLCSAGFGEQASAG